MAGRAAYQNKWQSENCDRINLVVKKGEKDRLKAHASGREPQRLHCPRDPRNPRTGWRRGPVGRGTENMRRPKNLGPQPLFLSLVFMITAGRFS